MINKETYEAALKGFMTTGRMPDVIELQNANNNYPVDEEIATECVNRILQVIDDHYDEESPDFVAIFNLMKGEVEFAKRKMKGRLK